MIIAIPKEIFPGEYRVAAVPETVAKMVKAGMEVHVEAKAGLRAYFSDQEYVEAGAIIEADPVSLLNQANIVFKVHRPHFYSEENKHELDNLQPHTTLIGPLDPLRHPDLVTKLKVNNITAFSLDFLPRIARAQSMDILSSMSNLAGYKSVILAADHLSKIFPMLTTAAGTIMPAKVMVIGAGVAGLQAIATARRLGGVVIAFDTRPVVAEQVQSLGGNFVSLETSHDNTEDAHGYAKEQSAEYCKNEQAIIRDYLKEADVVITTALIPGKRAPLLITAEMVKEMQPGSVIVDLASEQGGNCALTEPDKIVVKNDITLIGILNVVSTMPKHASMLYARNLYAFLNYITPQLKNNQFDFDDEIIKSCLITYNGEIIHPTVKQVLQ